MNCCVRSHIAGARGDDMIEMRRATLSFGDGLIAEEVSDLREDWMPYADQVLADEQIVAAVYEALAKRWPKSRSRGRRGTPAEVVLRLLVLKHIRNLSYHAVEREVRANLVYRDFTRVGGGKMPDADHGAVGLGGRTPGAQADPRSDGENSAGQRRRCGPADARRHDRGGEQHSLSDRQHVAGRRGAGADPHHEEGHGHCRRGRKQAARPQPEAKAPRFGRANAAPKRPPNRAQLHTRLSQFPKSRARGWGKRNAFQEEDRGRSPALPTSRSTLRGRASGRGSTGCYLWCGG